MDIHSPNLAHGETDHIIVAKMHYNGYYNSNKRSSNKVSRAVIIPKHENKPCVANT